MVDLLRAKNSRRYSQLAMAVALCCAANTSATFAADKAPEMTITLPVDKMLPHSSVASAAALAQTAEAPATPTDIDFNLPAAIVWSRKPLDLASATELSVVNHGDQVEVDAYKAQTYKVIDRVIVHTKDGRFFFTPRLDQTTNAAVAMQCLPAAAFDFSSPDGKVDANGVLSVDGPDPKVVAESGVRLATQLHGTSLNFAIKLKPIYSSLTEINVSPAPGPKAAADGEVGTSGTAGTRGEEGQGGGEGNDGSGGSGSGVAGTMGTRGGDGRPGGNGANGTAGKRGAVGHRGDNGADCTDKEIRIKSLKSPFYQTPLVLMTIVQGTKSEPRVVEWDQKISLIACGAAGSNGGNGGHGGDGGAGGAGGHGGRGGHGGKGGDGSTGSNGSAGRDATPNSQGGDGGQGQDGGAGGNGGMGGRGGNGGRGANSGNAGDGGNGGNAGNGGHGGHVIIKIQGGDAFAQMVKGAVAISVGGGQAGTAGNGGDPGNPGAGGAGGESGSAGAGGGGGSGGTGGNGGNGGSPSIRTYMVSAGTMMIPQFEPVPGGQGGAAGQSGRDGDQGQGGTDGQPGYEGQLGRSANPGKAGNPGQNGADGKVEVIVIPDE